ncbi:hypothetical protein AAG906_008568 [Vitis piasezkii]
MSPVLELATDPKEPIPCSSREGLEMQWKRLSRIPELHSQTEEMGKFVCTKPLKHSWSKDNLLVDASVGDEFHLQLHSPFCLRWTVRVPAGTDEVAIKLQVTGPVSAQVQVITIPISKG